MKIRGCDFQVAILHLGLFAACISAPAQWAICVRGSDPRARAAVLNSAIRTSSDQVDSGARRGCRQLAHP